jgi:hypothetical protein
VNASYYDDTGPINAIINDSRDSDDVFWSVASGNFGERHWRGVWADSGSDGLLDWSGSDETNGLSGSSDGCIFLNWDQYGNSVTDLDLYVVNRYQEIVAWSQGIQDGPQDPAEVLCFVNDPAQAPYGVWVYHYSGPTWGLDLTLFSFYNDLEYPVAEASLMDPANARGAYSVGAIFHGDYDLPNPLPEPYSSQGLTTDGRLKPDIAAPDGTTSFTYGPEGAFGTSFAAPVVAGAAALLLEDDPGLGAEDVAVALCHTAIDVGESGPDPVFGCGKLKVEIRSDCDDGVDNDGDGLTDYPEDPVCVVQEWSAEDSECADGVDNDGDGLTDYPDDPGCAVPFWPVEDPACSDGVDNDGDGFADFPADPGCPNAAAEGEAPACDDGADNDGDGFADFPADPGCLTAAGYNEAPACDDGVDNDGDGLVDLADAKCSVAGDRSEACGLGFELALLLPPMMRLYRRRRLGAS